MLGAVGQALDALEGDNRTSGMRWIIIAFLTFLSVIVTENVKGFGDR